MRTICVILSGGRSSRMGRDKAMLPFHGETFLARLVRQYSPAFPTYVSVGQAGKYDTSGARELVDLHPSVGPLAGLEAALEQTDADAVFLTATDLPFGTLTLARRLVELLGTADACVIRWDDGSIEPAFGVYRRSCLEPLRACLCQGRRSFRGLLDQVTVHWASEAELREFPLRQLLQNINTPESYQKALETQEDSL